MPRLLTLILLATCLVSAKAAAQSQESATQIPPSTAAADRDNRDFWTYIRPDLHLAGFTALQLEPVVLYRGAAAPFEDLSEADRQRFAQMLGEALRTEMARSFRLASSPAADALRLRVTLAGARKVSGDAGSVPSVVPIGLVTDASRVAPDEPGLFAGPLLLAFEIFDSRSGELLAAAVRRATPDTPGGAVPVSATDRVKSIADGMARTLRERLEDEKARQP